MKRGRLEPCGYFGTGRRGRKPKSAIPQKIVVTIAQMRSVHRKPTLSRRAVRTKGKMKPAEAGLWLVMRAGSVGVKTRTTNTSAGKNDSSCETSPRGEPFRKEFDDRDVEQPPADAKQDTLEHDEVPDLREVGEFRGSLRNKCIWRLLTCVAKLDPNIERKYNARPNHIAYPI